MRSNETQIDTGARVQRAEQVAPELDFSDADTFDDDERTEPRFSLPAEASK